MLLNLLAQGLKDTLNHLCSLDLFVVFVLGEECLDCTYSPLSVLYQSFISPFSVLVRLWTVSEGQFCFITSYVTYFPCSQAYLIIRPPSLTKTSTPPGVPASTLDRESVLFIGTPSVTLRQLLSCRQDTPGRKQGQQAARRGEALRPRGSECNEACHCILIGMQ
jgi:hypothetical protein